MKETDQPKTTDNAQPKVESAPALWENNSPRQGLHDSPEKPKPLVNEHAWSNPGEFKVTPDAQGRTERIEGWLELRDSERSSKDTALQKECASKASKDDERTWHGGHLVAHGLGGPTVDSHGDKDARSNLVPMDSRINQSHIEVYEKMVADELRAHPDRKLYMQVDVSYGDAGQARSVTHRLFREGSDGKPEAHELGSVQTSVGLHPSETLATTEGRQANCKAADFFHPSSRGTVPGIH